jgi:hypothetical protein
MVAGQLLWDDIDLEKGTLDIRRSAVIAPGRGVIISSPKTRHGHRTGPRRRRHRRHAPTPPGQPGRPPPRRRPGLARRRPRVPLSRLLLLHPGLVSKAFTSLTSTAALPSIRLHDYADVRVMPTSVVDALPYGVSELRRSA